MLALLAASRVNKHRRNNDADPSSNGDSSDSSSPHTHTQWQPGVRNFLSRKLGHLTPSLWFANPYHESRGVLAKEDGGRLRRKEKKVGFIELFYDLFFVAALNVFTRESTFAEGIQVAEYVVFVTLLFSIWISQTYFDARFALTDRLSWLYSFMNLLVYGYIAASSGNLNIAYGLTSSSHSSDEAAELVDLPQYIQPVGPVESEDPTPTLISLEAVSAVYAISRVILCFQYLRLVYMARKAGHSVKPPLYNAVGLGLSAACFYAALGLSIARVTQGRAIARLGMWVIGLLIELTSLVLSATTSRAIWYSLDYWAERFAAVVLIILGEGVIGLFEQFRFVYTGVAVGFRASIIGQLFSAVAIYRIIFAQYFANAHSPDIRGGTATHLLWGLLHYPFIISLLLFLQSVTKSLASTNILLGVQEYVAIIESLEGTIDNLSTSGIGIDQYRERLTSSDAYPSLVSFASDLGVNFDRNLENFALQAGGNIEMFVKMFAGSVYSVTARIFFSYGYDPSAESYTYIDEALSESANPDYFEIFATHVTLLLNPVYTSVVYGFTVLGGYLIFLFALAVLEKKRKSVFWKIQYGYRLGLGILMLLLTMLDIGHLVRSENLLGGGTDIAPIYRLLATSTFTAILFLVLFSVVVVDLAVMALKAYHVDQKSKGLQKMSDSEEGETRNEKFSIQRAPTHAAEAQMAPESKPEENNDTVQPQGAV